MIPSATKQPMPKRFLMFLRMEPDSDLAAKVRDSRLRSKGPDLRWLAALGRNTEIQLVARRKKECRACADCRGNSLQQRIVVWIVHLIHADSRLSTGNVYPLAGSIKEKIVGI